MLHLRHRWSLVVIAGAVAGAGLGLPSAAPGEPAAKIRGKDGAWMVRVPAGPFLRGSAAPDAPEDQRPQRRITLRAFYIDRTEVDNARYVACVKAGACTAPVWDTPGNKYHLKTGRKRHTYRRLTGPHQPVVGVTWEQARAYCAWAGKRLPTDAEWEKAARGTDGRTYPWGEDPPTCARAVFHRGDGKGPCRPTHAPVGSHRAGASPYGALNMAGNVWEWVADRHAKTALRDAPTENPTGPDTGDERVMRGGSLRTEAPGLTTTYRICRWPRHSEHDLGFRCASTGATRR